jgi:hypothetical protein
MTPKTLLAAAAVAALASACTEAPRSAPEPAATEDVGAEGAAATTRAVRTPVKPVTTGVVVRGVNAPLPIGQSGTANGRNCDFSREEVDQTGHMTGASVQCLAGGTLEQALAHLPVAFNSYCSVNASRLKGRLIAAAISGNAEHCDLSGIKPADAQGAFGGGKWR